MHLYKKEKFIVFFNLTTVNLIVCPFISGVSLVY